MDNASCVSPKFVPEPRVLIYLLEFRRHWRLSSDYARSDRDELVRHAGSGVVGLLVPHLHSSGAAGDHGVMEQPVLRPDPAPAVRV